jgi:hypothetical protein
VRTFLATWAVPQNALEIAAGAVGVLAAVFCVLSASNTAQERTKFWLRTRFQALLWLFAGGVMTVAVEWDAVRWFEGVNKPHLVGLYFIWVVSAVAATFIVGVAWIIIDAILMQRSAKLRHAVATLVVRFVVDGWSAYERVRDECLQEELTAAASVARSQAEAADRTALVVTTLALRVLGALSGGDRTDRQLLIDQIMQVIHAEIVKFAPEPKPVLRLNYLIAIPWRRVYDQPALLWNPLYPIRPDGRYSNMLDLRYRMQDGQREPVGAPIRIAVADHIASPDTVLPGAPEVLAWGEARLISRNARGEVVVNFRPGVSETDRKAIRAYFQTLWFHGLLTLRLDTNLRSVGVLNIESSLPDLIGRGSAGVENLARMLKSLCQILAYVVEKEHENDLG